MRSGRKTRERIKEDVLEVPMGSNIERGVPPCITGLVSLFFTTQSSLNKGFGGQEGYSRGLLTVGASELIIARLTAAVQSRTFGEENNSNKKCRWKRSEKELVQT